MKLKKLIATILAILVTVGAVIGEYVYFTKKSASMFEDIIVAAVDIKKGEKITQDKLALVRVAAPTPIPAAKNPAEILNKYVLYDIKRGEPIIPAKLTVKPPIDVSKGQYSILIKIEPVPSTFVAKYDTIRLMFVSNTVDAKTQKPAIQILDTVQVKNMYDANFKTIEEVTSQQNAYQPMNVAYIEVLGNKDTVVQLKQLEKTGTFVVLKDMGQNQ
ncbi:SAF domain-containing protein [Anaerocellum danielii]|uniref:SAF domain-containing protein n=1 Tax=Anaerocellum danielii TaxID=1387557 RepID=A0ABZ0TXH4_9FIRM|nr:SAF domain-containing protein [Caldicellulosiruptor danielii]WPX08151.1 SAF domain-containing protein [Caldicellulosiruptor danielii]